MPAKWTNPDTKTCKGCGGVFTCDLAHFYRSADGYWNPKCKACCQAVTKAWRTAHPDYQKNRRYAKIAGGLSGFIAPNEEF